MPKVSDNNASTTRRRSARPQAKGKKTKIEESTSAAIDVSDDAQRMPAGYNPSDDSEDEYVPPEKKKKSILTKAKRSRKESDGSDSDDEDSAATPAKRARGKKSGTATPSQSKKSGTVTPSQSKKSKQTTLHESLAMKAAATAATTKTEAPVVKTEPKQLIFNNKCSCPFENCKDKLTVDGNAKFHLALHYYDENKYSTEDILIPQDADASGRAVDEKGRSIKYSCDITGCTKRKMGYKEMCVHIATQHGKLQTLMEKDPSQDVRDLHRALFPPPEGSTLVDVKKEDVAAPEAGPRSMDNSEDEDDPDDPSPAPAKATPSRRGPPPKSKPVANVQSNNKNVKSPGFNNNRAVAAAAAAAAQKSRPKVDKITNCILCDEKDGKNLNAGTSELKYHLSVCVYSMGGFLDILPAHQGTKDIKKIEEFGNRFKYKCPFENCDKSSGKSKPIGYKEFAIHAGVMHGILERWAEKETNRKGAPELYQLLKNMREEEGIQLPEIPDIPFEELHVCYICDGEDKEGKNLSFSADKVYQARYHYSACVYDTGLYVDLYPPGKQNLTADGKPRDILGREVKYSCQEKGCSLKRKMGYKEFVIHMANDHGGLEKVLENHSDQRVREISKKLKVKRK